MDLESQDPIFNANLGQDENLMWTKKLRCSHSMKPFPYFEDIKTTCLSRLFALLRYTYQDQEVLKNMGQLLSSADCSKLA